MVAPRIPTGSSLLSGPRSMPWFDLAGLSILVVRCSFSR